MIDFHWNREWGRRQASVITGHQQFTQPNTRLDNTVCWLKDNVWVFKLPPALSLTHSLPLSLIRTHWSATQHVFILYHAVQSHSGGVHAHKHACRLGQPTHLFLSRLHLFSSLHCGAHGSLQVHFLNTLLFCLVSQYCLCKYWYHFVSCLFLPRVSCCHVELINN